MAGARDGIEITVIDGHHLEHRWVGQPSAAPPLVLLHEGLGCVDLWRDVPDRLSAATGRRVLVYSRAGYGRSDPVPPPRGVDYLHHEALVVLPALLRELAVTAPLLVGHSDGASIALIAAGAGIVTASALVLLAPHVFVEDRSIAAIASAKRAYETTDLRQRLAQYHRDADATFRGWNDVWLSPAFRSWNIEPYLAGVTSPILAIQGLDDQYGTLAQLDAIASGVPSTVEQVRVDDCGHAPHLERPEITLPAIAAFVRGQAAPIR